MIRSAILDAEYNIRFPYKTFPWRLEHGTTVCHFECQEHLEKYIDRYKLKSKDVTVENIDGKILSSFTEKPKRTKK